MSSKTVAQEILEFNDSLGRVSLEVLKGFNLINAFNGVNKDTIKHVLHKFYTKYYNDTDKRFMILGSSPARRGTALTGVPFEDVNHLQKDTGISLDAFGANKRSSSFLYEVMEEYGGRQNFYKQFYMSFVCPLGIEKINEPF